MKFSSSCISYFSSSSDSSSGCVSSDSGFVFSSARAWKLLRSGEMGEMGESLGFGKDGRGDGEAVEVGVDVGEDGADGEGVGGGGFSFWFRG